MDLQIIITSMSKDFIVIYNTFAGWPLADCRTPLPRSPTSPTPLRSARSKDFLFNFKKTPQDILLI
jgi:hypothetical protein